MSELRGGASVPRSPFPLLPLRTGVLFPGTVITIPVGRERSVALLQSLEEGQIIGVATQKDPASVNPDEGDLFSYGTFARVKQIARPNQREYRLVLEGLGRFELTKVVRTDPFFLAEGSPLDEVVPEGDEARLLAQALREHVEEIAASSGGALSPVAASENEPGVVADQVAAGLGLATDKEVQVLGTLDVLARLRLVSTLLA